jgi:hypothetical protein
METPAGGGGAGPRAQPGGRRGRIANPSWWMRTCEACRSSFDSRALPGDAEPWQWKYCCESCKTVDADAPQVERARAPRPAKAVREMTQDAVSWAP